MNTLNGLIGWFTAILLMTINPSDMHMITNEAMIALAILILVLICTGNH